MPENKKIWRADLNQPIGRGRVVVFFVETTRVFTCGFYPQEDSWDASKIHPRP